MVKDGEDLHGLQTANLKNLGLTLQHAQTVMFSANVLQARTNFTFL